MKKKTSTKKNFIFGMITGSILTVLLASVTYCIFTSKDRNSENYTKPSKSIAMYIEDDEGNFQPSTSKTFPTDGYVLDLDKSTCSNGGVLSQNPNTKKINLIVNKADKCNLYFKKEVKKTNATTLLAKANATSITDYNSGDKGEMFTFTHPEAEQTTGWSEVERTDYRYIGNTPNNYINFNGETWRIIGVFTVEGENGEKEQRIKIIRDEPIGNFTWDKKSNSKYTNEWPTSTTATMLNGDYINQGGSFTYKWYTPAATTANSIIDGLLTTSKSQIAPTKWYLGGCSTVSADGPTFYNFERGTTTCETTGKCSGETRSTYTIAYVGLMYPSDYVYTYANGVDNICYTNGNNCKTSVSGNPSNGWLYNSNFLQWAITSSTFPNYIFYVKDDGSVSNIYERNYHVRPCVYLRSDIEITGGNGSSENPYTLSVPTQ